MPIASDSENDLPVFHFLELAFWQDLHGFLYTWYSMKQFLPDVVVKKIILDSAHDAMPYYQYFMEHGISSFIDLNDKRGCQTVYKEEFTINSDGDLVCPQEHTMRMDGTEKAKERTKFKCPKISFVGGKLVCTCESPCYDTKYGRTVHLVLKDNTRLFNDQPRSSKEWKVEFNARTSSE